jgi:hypothetical protein
LFADDIREYETIARRRATTIKMTLHNESVRMVAGTVSVDE